MIRDGSQLKKHITSIISNDNPLIVSISNFAFNRIALNWVAALKRLNISNYLIFALDNKAHTIFKQNNVNTFLYTTNANNWSDLCIDKIRIPLKVLKTESPVIYSDTDAVWIRNPLPELQKQNADLIFSTCHHSLAHPDKIKKAWGFTLCTGWFLAYPSNASKKLLHMVIQSLKNKGRRGRCDQKEMNYVLFKNIKKIKALNDGSFLIRASNNLNIYALNANIVHRGKKENSLFVSHPISPKTEKGTISILQQEGLWFI